MLRLPLFFLLGTALLAPLTSAAGEPLDHVTARTEASPNLKRGTLTVRVRAISRRRFVVRTRFHVNVRKPTYVVVFFHPCRRAWGSYSCLEEDLHSFRIDLAEGEEDKSYRAVVTRRGRELKRPCVSFNAADQNPGGRRAYDLELEGRTVLCPWRNDLTR